VGTGTYRIIGVRSTASVAATEGGLEPVCARNFKGRLPPFLEEGIGRPFEGWNQATRWNTIVEIRCGPRRCVARSTKASLGEPRSGMIYSTPERKTEVVTAGGKREIEGFFFTGQCWAFAEVSREARAGDMRRRSARLAEKADGRL